MKADVDAHAPKTFFAFIEKYTLQILIAQGLFFDLLNKISQKKNFFPCKYLIVVVFNTPLVRLYVGTSTYCSEVSPHFSLLFDLSVVVPVGCWAGCGFVCII